LIEIRINSPTQLRKAISIIKGNIEDGTIENININLSNTPFSDLIAGKPWEDYFIYYFNCTNCRQEFELTVETYHGGGGWWKPIKLQIH